MEKQCFIAVNAKRRRSEPSAETSFPEDTSRDCYEDVLRGRGGSFDPNSTIRSSWLRHTEWLSSSIQSRGALKDDGENTRAEIKSLQAKLSQVKRLLGPAAERCTEACNSCYDGTLTTGRREFLEARRACNPFEVLGEGQSGGLNNLFMNRAAIKLANVDAILDFCLTQNNGEGPFLFADLCGAPGGFSEYLLRRCHATEIPACRGYGMSLVGSNEHGHGTPWKLQDAVYFETGTHCEYRVIEGADGTGDIFQWDNVAALRNAILSDSPEHPENPADAGMVHLVMADGGFDAQRDSEHQEELAQKLIVCEVAAGLALLRRGGTMVVKMFGFQTAVVRAVMKDLLFMFDRVIALKPISSRPASAERYVVCAGFKGLPPDFNGPRWRNRMFLGQSVSHFAAPDQGVQVTECLYRYLDQFDCDMLQLNLKACFAILSHLENKCMESARIESDVVYHERAFVDVEAYKCAWRLL